jgi:hypothetical protein
MSIERIFYCDWRECERHVQSASSRPSTFRAEKIIEQLGSHALTLSHAHHIDCAQAQAMGLKVVPLEKDKALQDAVLTVHHLCIDTLAHTAVVKLIENQAGITFATSLQVQQVGN